MSLDEILWKTGISPPHYSKKFGKHFDLFIAGEKVAHIPFNLDNLVEYGTKFGLIPSRKALRHLR